ncbi:MAG: hypothetical protein WDO14_19275 [Bacteroidota bacterium]
MGGSGSEILTFRFPNGQSLDESSGNMAEGYLELSPEQEAVVSSVRFVFTVGGLECDDAGIPDALGADPDTTYLKTLHDIEFKVSEVGLGGRNPMNSSLYQFVYNDVCLSFRMDVTEAPDVSANPNIAYQSIDTTFENFLGSLKMKRVLN